MQHKVKCDTCRTIIKDIAPRIQKQGDIEYTYFQCHRCGEIYPISCTDSALRKEIRKYQAFAAKIQKMHKQGKVTPADIEKAEQMMRRNVARSKELMASNNAKEVIND